MLRLRILAGWDADYIWVDQYHNFECVYLEQDRRDFVDKVECSQFTNIVAIRDDLDTRIRMRGFSICTRRRYNDFASYKVQ